MRRLCTYARPTCSAATQTATSQQFIRESTHLSFYTDMATRSEITHVMQAFSSSRARMAA
eukprot:633711-Pleurochrysis_carterae.AAC.3